MKTQAERKFYQQVDANQLQDSFHSTETSAEHVPRWSCGIREEMVAEDKRLYEEWRCKTLSNFELNPNGYLNRTE